MRQELKAPAFALLVAISLFALLTDAEAQVTTKAPGTGSAWSFTYPSDTGTSGYFLQTDGTGVTTWADPSMHFISTQTASSSAALQFTSLSTSYNSFFLNCSGLHPASNNVTMQFQVGTGGTPTWATANYRYTGHLAFDDGTSSAINGQASQSAAAIFLSTASGVGNNAAYNATAKLYISNTASSSIYKMVHGNSTFMKSAGGIVRVLVGGTYQGATTAVTAIRILFSSGNIATGTCSLYGIN